MQRIKGHINSSFTVYDGALADDPTHQLFLCVCVCIRGESVYSHSDGLPGHRRGDLP